MSKILKKASFWVRRKSHLPLLLIGSLVVALLFFNDDASISLNMQYDREINALTEEIAACRDTAAYYREQRLSLINGNEDLEHVARERFHMQRPTEDVFILK